MITWLLTNGHTNWHPSTVDISFKLKHNSTSLSPSAPPWPIFSSRISFTWLVAHPLRCTKWKVLFRRNLSEAGFVEEDPFEELKILGTKSLGQFVVCCVNIDFYLHRSRWPSRSLGEQFHCVNLAIGAHLGPDRIFQTHGPLGQIEEFFFALRVNNTLDVTCHRSLVFECDQQFHRWLLAGWSSGQSDSQKLISFFNWNKLTQNVLVGLNYEDKEDEALHGIHANELMNFALTSG